VTSAINKFIVDLRVEKSGTFLKQGLTVNICE